VWHLLVWYIGITVSEKSDATTFHSYSEDGNGKFLRNVGVPLLNYTPLGLHVKGLDQTTHILLI
jgi:hypothetical protein